MTTNIYKKILLSIILLMMIGLLSCTDTETTSTTEATTTEHQSITYSNFILDWDDVEDAVYYKINFYHETGELLMGVFDYAYVSQMNMKMYFISNKDYYVKIYSYYENGDVEISDLFHINYNVLFPHPYYLDEGYDWGEFMWRDTSNKSGFKNYTLNINDETYTLEENFFDIVMENNSIYEITVRANYLFGASQYTEPYYKYMFLNPYVDVIEYDMWENEDVFLEFDENEEIIVALYEPIYHWISTERPLPEGAVQIAGNTMTINKWFMQTSFSHVDQFEIKILTTKNLYEYYFRVPVITW